MKKLLFCLLVILLLSACTIKEIDKNQNNNNNNSNNSNHEQKEEVSSFEPSFEVRKLENINQVTLEDFFNLGNRVDIAVEISDSELNKLQKDYETGYKSEIYRLADKVTISLTNYSNKFEWVYENVGIRQKGNTSRKDIITNGNINLNHFKLSFDETFTDPNKYDASFISTHGNSLYENRKFLGMSGLDFKWNKNEDTTYIREIFANYLFRSSGILAQRSGLSTFKFIQNDQNNKETSLGLCTVFEPATKSLIKRLLKSSDKFVNMDSWAIESTGNFGLNTSKYGDLYKCIWGADLTKNSISGSNIGVGNISGSYIPIYERKTNTDVVYNDSLLKNAVNAISTRNYEEINKYIDLEYLAIYSAVAYIVGNPDDVRNNMNNYMIYFRKTDGKMIFIPIDNDRCFGIVKDWNIKNGMLDTNVFSSKNSNNNDTLTLFLDTILSSSNEAREIYVKHLNKLIESKWLEKNTFKTYYELAKNNYSEYRFSLTDSSINITYDNYIDSKINSIKKELNISNEQESSNSYNNLYLVSTINNWGSYSVEELSKYKLQLIGENTYQITFKVTKLESDGNYIKFKINNGYANYDQIDWSFDESLTKLLKSPGLKSAKLYNVKVGDTVTLTINTSTCSSNIKIN